MIDFDEKRRNLVDKLQKSGYLKSKNVILAMLNIPRENFLTNEKKNLAYKDTPISLFDGQTISAPHMNAIMCELLDLKPGMKILEIGTGSGYHAALCAYIVGRINKEKIGFVFTIERNLSLANFAESNLKLLNYDNITKVICGDGTLGYEEKAPYDRILVTAAGPKIPQPLLNQLKIGGKICLPIGSKNHSQNLIIIEKKKDGFKKSTICGVIFVPLIGKYGF